jgi:hypothetical protein
MSSYAVQRHATSGEAFAIRYDEDNQITGVVHLDVSDLAIVEEDPSTLLNPDYDEDGGWEDGVGPETWSPPMIEYDPGTVED